jgi:class 3 adenylate cyclase
MPRLQVKSFTTPDEIRDLPKGRAHVVKVDDTTVGRASWEPGWQWSKDLRPIAGTPSCEVHHLGYSLSGTLRVVMDHGPMIDIPPDSIYEIPPGHDATVIGDEPWVTVEWTSAHTVGIPAEGADQRVVATLLFTDIVDSTATLQRVGDTTWRDLLAAHNTRLRGDLSLFRGREVATTGDGFLAVFDSATRAVRCGTAMIRSARALGLSIRVGIHTGELEFVGGDARGVAVHAAARILALAGADQVFVSSTTHDLLEGSGLTFEDAGTHNLKGLPGLRAIYRVAA